MIDNPAFTDVTVALRLTHDDDGQPMLYVENGGYFPIPSAVIGELEQVQQHFSAAATTDMSTRFVLHAMLGK